VCTGDYYSRTVSKLFEAQSTVDEFLNQSRRPLDRRERRLGWILLNDAVSR